MFEALKIAFEKGYAVSFYPWKEYNAFCIRMRDNKTRHLTKMVPFEFQESHDMDNIIGMTIKTMITELEETKSILTKLEETN